MSQWSHSKRPGPNDRQTFFLQQSNKHPSGQQLPSPQSRPGSEIPEKLFFPGLICYNYRNYVVIKKSKGYEHVQTCI